MKSGTSERTENQSKANKESPARRQVVGSQKEAGEDLAAG